MHLERFVVGMYEANCLILHDEKTLEALVIDPGDNPRTLIQYLQKKSLKPVGIVLTHYHCDHIGGVEDIVKKFLCPVMIHKKDLEGLQNPTINHSQELFGREISITPERLLSDGDTIEAGSITLKVIHTPGHTPGGICLEVVGESLILTGDTLFDDGLGRTDLAGGEMQALRKSIINKIAKWSDQLTIYPGHGESATMSEVRKRNYDMQAIIQKGSKR